MLSPKDLNDIPKELEDYFSDLEYELIKDIAKRIKVANFDKITTTSNYHIQKARQLGIAYDDFTKKVADYLKVSDKKVKKLITEAVYKGVQNDLEMSGINFNQSFADDTALSNELANGIKSTNSELKNFTKTMAKESTAMLEKALDDAFLQVRSGAFDYNTAITNAVEHLGKKGIQCVNYAGHSDHVDVAVRRAVLTGVNQTVCKMQLLTAKKYNLNYAHVTQHVGARPTHAVWQGKVYWVFEEVAGMDNFHEATGFGTGEGLGGWNCRHNFYVLNHPDSNLTPIDTEENKRVYNLTQEQRYYERTVRYWKRRLAAKQGAGLDDSKEQLKVREWNKKLRTLVDANPELKRQWSREKPSIGSVKIPSGALDRDSPKALKHAEKYYNSVRKMRTDCDKISVNTGYPKELISRIKNYVFIEEHSLDYGKERFYPDYDMAQSWQRLIFGKNIQKHDLLLLEHELYESILVESGMSVREAHKMTSQLYDYEKGLNDFYGNFKKY